MNTATTVTALQIVPALHVSPRPTLRMCWVQTPAGLCMRWTSDLIEWPAARPTTPLPLAA